MAYLEIEKVVGREILDSRGNPTVEAEVTLLTVLFQEVLLQAVRQQVSLRLLSFVTATRADISVRVFLRQLKILIQ